MPRHLPLVLLFTVTLFVSAGLLFLVQPLQARMVLPLLGGSPAVWNTCMVFFQAVLLLGYGYTHLLPAWLGTRRHALLHLAVLATPILVLPVALPSGWAPPTTTTPIFWLLGVLAVTVGLPFFCVATTAPLLQRWFTSTGHPGANDPYFLYAASNLGSILALLSYPVVVEPLFNLATQNRLWAAGYLVFFLLITACTVVVWFARGGAKSGDVPMPPPTASPATPLTWWRRLRWLVLAFVPASFMLSVTTYLTTDVAPMPLLWVLPLAVYLLTFVLVFARKPLIPHRVFLRWMPLIVVIVLVLLLSEATEPLGLLLVLHLLALFWIGMVCHGELARDRPASEHLTEFYLLLCAGGVLGGLFNAFVAVLVFKSVLEYPVVLVLACLLRPPLPPAVLPPAAAPTKKQKGKPQPQPTQRPLAPVVLDFALPTLLACLTVGAVLAFQKKLEPGPISVAVLFAPAIVVCYLFKERPIRFGLGAAGILLASGFYFGIRGQTEYSARSFFGVHRVTDEADHRFRALYQGNTLHGRQNLYRLREPLTYYNRAGPIGQVFEALKGDPNVKHVGVVGLGCGTLSCYAERGQEWTFYEIDPVVIHIASGPGALFTFCDEAKRSVGVTPNIIPGDARLTLAAAGEVKYDVLVIDAFSSDSIPLHLLTREALGIFLSHLNDNGILAFHISNRYLNLAPVLGDLAGDAEPPLVCKSQSFRFDTKENVMPGVIGSDWVVMSRTEAALAVLKDERWRPVEKRPGVAVWTDDYTNLLSVWRWQ